MSAELYYFSGTGNSLAVARDTGHRLDAKLIPIAATLDKESIEPDAGALGIVCPTYYMRVPRIVEGFIGKLANLQHVYVFAIVTVGGIAGGVLEQLAEAIGRRGGHLAAGFIVRMPANYIHDADALPLFIQKRMFNKWAKRADKIAENIINGNYGIMEKSSFIMSLLFSRGIERDYREGALRPDIDENFWADSRCDGCGICVRVCPVGNIELLDGSPVWQHRCEKCLSCIQWCPKEAIQFRDVTLERKRYHHPEVKLADMLKRRA